MSGGGGKLVVGLLEIDLDTQRVHVAGARVRLTAMQLRLLVHLVRHRDQVLSRAVLLREVWGYREYRQTRTVDIHVKRLRERLGRRASGLISTVRSVGYLLSEEAD